MIERLQRIAGFLSRLRALIVSLALAFLALFTAALFELAGIRYDDFLVPSLIGFCWAVTLLSFAGLFARVPARPDSGTGFLRRLRVRAQRGMFWLLALLMLGLTAALLMFSSQLLRTWLSA